MKLTMLFASDMLRRWSMRRGRPPSGRVILIAGVVPLAWRAELRNAQVSFVDMSGVAEINWPRLHVSAKRFGKPVERRRGPLAFQKGHALVVHELLVLSMDGSQPTHLQCCRAR